MSHEYNDLKAIASTLTLCKFDTFLNLGYNPIMDLVLLINYTLSGY